MGETVDLEALKKKLGSFQIDMSLLTSGQLHLEDDNGNWDILDLTPDESRVVLAAAVNAGRAERMKKFVTDVEVAVSRRDEIYNFNEVLENMADAARALLREHESEAQPSVGERIVKGLKDFKDELESEVG